MALKATDKPAKELTISFTKGMRKPEFKFTGLWNGHDIGVIFRHLRTEYHLQNRTIRRTDQATDTLQPSEQEA